ncbi:unnamed protein product [Parnassius apollo]|uniref:(apollo) hypothetical protein n=1 Tax=Parnassius apollo TaxID=110799 RepID=A0A8S3X788_PARAO|nr:unnamed protein product [Parnassius apollo]
MRWTKSMNENKLRAYYRAKGEETVGIAYRARMHCFFAELEPSIPVMEQNLADRVRYIMRSKIFDDAELERLRREAIPSLRRMNRLWPEMQLHIRQTSIHTWKPPWIFQVVVDSNDDEIVSHERASEEYIGRGDFGNAQHPFQKSTVTSPHTPKQTKSGCRDGS